MNFKSNNNYNIKTVCIFAFIAFFVFIGLLGIIKKTCFTYKTPVNKVYSGILNNTMPVINNGGTDDIQIKNSFSKIMGMNSKSYLSVLGKEIAYLSANEEYRKLEDEKNFKEKDPEHIFNEFTLNDDQVYVENVDKSKAGENGDMTSAPVFSKELQKKMPSKPEVLIYHTHTCESYMPYGVSTNGWNTTDQTKSVVAVGEEIKKELNKYGVSVLHDNTVHDVKDYNNAYKYSRVTLKKYLKQYGDFKLIIDLHRDSIVNKDEVTTRINGENVARFEFVMVRKNPHSAKNIQLAETLKGISNKLYPGNKTTRSYNRGTWYYNYGKNLYSQDLSNNALLIEVGSHVNTLEEAKASSKYLARIIAQYINGKN
ncbi:stage II sporulation protein P [Clostridium novyi A str. 4552]|uniref:Stage II sporulation protein P n=1 Tax=Clostridium novyi A str. 4552 TaxID=1444289 RepID=A0A0A0IE58_CLONO|nr:stage II sporulation protein P [Clostridium novyi]KGM97920.1 stage II sporulation protein P [Clostridium novyi A str. 4552]